MNPMDAIEHVVLVIFENRSFDHLLGWMGHPKYGGNPAIAGLRGNVDPSTGAIDNDDYENDGVGFPFQPYFVDADGSFLSDLPHGRDEVTTQMAWDRGHQKWTMQGFSESFFNNNPNMGIGNPKPPENLRMLGPSAAPMTAFLARNYCVCDHWFTPIPTDTHPNRFMALAGYSKIDQTQGGFPEPNHRLVSDWATDANVPWRFYSQDFSFNSLILDRLSSTLTDLDHYRRFNEFARDYQDLTETFPALTIIEPGFADDPFVSAPDDNHPPFPMGPGENFLLQIYQALCGTAAARTRWQKTMLVVYYDEHGGFFDHVPPLSVATPCGKDPGETQWAAFTTTGPRVPAIVASPLVEPGSVYSGNLDHTSVLRFLAERFSKAPYSDRVTARHASGVLKSLGEVLTLTTPRDNTPVPPRLGPFQTVAFPGGRPVKSAAEKMFLAARQQAHADHADALGDTHPDSFFKPR